MNDEIYMLANLVHGLDFPSMHDAIVEVGEIPFQENLKALRAFDIRSDVETGTAALTAALEGIDEMINELELYRDDTETVSKQAIAGLRSS